MLRESAAQEHGPSDGGGRAWLDPGDGPPRAVVGRPGRFAFVYEVGPLGIATDGMIYLQVSPFWGWSTPQVEVPEAPGFTTIEPSADDIELNAETLDQQLLGIRVTGRPLVAGDRIRIVYGAGPARASVDRFAEKNSRFWIAVDGDADGTRRFLVDSPGIDVAPGPPELRWIASPRRTRASGSRWTATAMGPESSSSIPRAWTLPPVLQLG